MLTQLSPFQTPKTAGLRPMEKKDIPVVHQLLTRYLKQFHLTPVMSREEVEHWFYPQENIIDTFVVNTNGEVTDFLSFYTLPSTIMNHPTHKSLKAAYSFYNVHTQTPLLDLMSDALVLAKMVSSGPKGPGALGRGCDRVAVTPAHRVAVPTGRHCAPHPPALLR